MRTGYYLLALREAALLLIDTLREAISIGRLTTLAARRVRLGARVGTRIRDRGTWVRDEESCNQRTHYDDGSSHV
jgi:hypothetical protein